MVDEGNRRVEVERALLRIHAADHGFNLRPAEVEDRRRRVARAGRERAEAAEQRPTGF